jgi:3-dehydroquinate synthase
MLAEGRIRCFKGEADWPAFRDWLVSGSFSQVLVLADTHTAALALPRLEDKLGRRFDPLIIPAGEPSKTLDQARRLWEALLERGVDRRALLLLLGGGVVTDLGGFVAATYKRGIAFAPIPTSLLAQVDAAIGGKTGVDLGFGKNLVGTFSSPAAIMTDPAFLATLPEEEWRSGLAEVIKHGLIGDAGLFARLESLAGPQDLAGEDILAAAAFKREIVARDPFESGLRRILNFGHTIGHALESLALEMGAPIRHGEAVAAGMRLEGWISSRINGLPSADLVRLRILVRRIFPPLPEALFRADRLLPYLRQDKKNCESRIGMVLLSGIGEARHDALVDEELVAECLHAQAAGQA